MNTNLWLITAKTNLHVGNESTSNYGIIDKAIQRDPLTNVPCINSSSLKGAINEYCSQQDSEGKDIVMEANERKDIFGSDKRGKGNAKKGEAIFYDAKLLFLPFQTNDKDLYRYVTSSKVLDEFESRLNIFGISFPLDRQNLKNIFSLNREVEVNDELFASCCSDEDLPIIARNRLDDGTSSNLWYEQVLPSETVLFSVTQEPQSVLCNAIENKIVQIGANATIGYGYCEFRKLKIVHTMKKSRNNELIELANDVLNDSNMINNNEIAETYNGKTAALSVSVAMSDILPTLAIYFQDYDARHPNNPCRRNILNVVARMITDPSTNRKFVDAEGLLRYATSDNAKLDYIKTEVIDCAIALKQVVRTYKLK